MSEASFAFLRKSQGEELAKLAEEHFKHEYGSIAEAYFKQLTFNIVSRKMISKL